MTIQVKIIHDNPSHTHALQHYHIALSILDFHSFHILTTSLQVAPDVNHDELVKIKAQRTVYLPYHPALHCLYLLTIQ